jgi:hypothetical protein
VALAETKPAMTDTHAQPAHRPTTALPALALVALGSCGFAAAWVLLAFARDRQCSWMAVFAAIDAVLLLRLARMPAGWMRMLAAVVATAVSIALANWGIAAAQIGKLMGLLPWESAFKLGPQYAWTLIGLANQPADMAWLAAALLLAAIASR